MLSGFWRKPPIFSFPLPVCLIVVKSRVNCPSSQPADFNRRFILPCPLSGLPPPMVSFCGRGRGQDVNSFTACGNPTIRLAAPVKKGSGTHSPSFLSPPPRRVSLHFAPSLLVLRHLQSFGCTAHEHDGNACTPNFNFTTWNV